MTCLSHLGIKAKHIVSNLTSTYHFPMKPHEDTTTHIKIKLSTFYKILFPHIQCKATILEAIILQND